MKTSILYLSNIIFAVLYFSSCASLTGYQDGRSVGEGNGEAMISLNFSQSPTFSDLEELDEIEEIPRFAFPNIELAGKYGATEKLDVTLRMNTNLNLGVGAKYQLIGDRSSEFALGLGAEAGTFGLITGLWNVQLPLYTSFHPTEKFSIYASPRFIYQFTTIGGTEGWNYLGGNFGFLFGSRHKFGLDIGYYQVGATGVDNIGLVSVGIGGKFAFGSNNGSSNASSGKTKKKKR
ncbi:MAG: hypothetical protein IPK35_17750 [Saprospiraceae bacterium]|jgi:hypothetical protein|nr:hypothetical protein [Saprospiraceae bacterium]